MKILPYLASVIVLTACVGAQPASRPADDATDRWEPDIQRFERADREDPPRPGRVVFVGSSSIRLWESLATDFPDIAVLNRGFGGSELGDVLHYADRIVLPYRPRTVVVYAGENDLNAGKSPDQVVAAYQGLVRRVHDELPHARILFVSVKPSPSRWHLEPQMRRTNARVREITDHDPRLLFVDIFDAMLDSEGRPREELYVEDRLHMNERGYAIWRAALEPYLR